MDSLADDYTNGVFSAPEPPCLSLYQPTHRHSPENQQDRIRYRNLLKSLAGSLALEYKSSEVKEHLRPFEELAEDKPFWEHALDGLAVLGAAGLFRVYRLQAPVPEMAVVAPSFHIKPLLRFLQSSGSYHVLGLRRDKMQLFVGDRGHLDEMGPASGVPRTMVEALGEETTEPHLTVGSYGGAEGTAMHHGHGGRSADVETDTIRYFRAVDRAVLEHHSKPSGRPLVLAALPEHQALFRELSRNPNLLGDGIPVHPDDMDDGALREQAWRVVEPRLSATLADFADEYGSAVQRGTGDADPQRIAEASLQGRVKTLVLEAERTLPGRIDADTGAVTPGDLEQPEIGDVLDDLAEMVLAQGGEVVVAPADQMPSSSGAAAIFRF